MDDDTRGQRLVARLNAVMPSWGQFDDLGDGTLVNETLDDREANITIRDGEAVVSLITRDIDTGEYLDDYELGEVKWNDVEGIVRLLASELGVMDAYVRTAEGSASLQGTKSKKPRSGSGSSGSVKVKGYTRRFPLR